MAQFDAEEKSEMRNKILKPPGSSSMWHAEWSRTAQCRLLSALVYIAPSGPRNEKAIPCLLLYITVRSTVEAVYCSRKSVQRGNITGYRHETGVR
jgi:hypothetical protein